MTHHDDASTFADVLAHFGDDGTKDLFRRLLEQALQDLIDAEVTAELLDHKFLTWTMVKVKGSVSANQSKTMYLVVHGAPLTIGGADPEEVTRSSQHLVSEINSVRPT